MEVPPALLLLWLALPALLIVSAEEDKDSKSPTVSKTSDNDDDKCSGQEECAGLELERWFESVKDPRAGQFDGCAKDGGKDEGKAKEGTLTKCEPVFRVAKSCDAKGAIWHYKYSGQKGKKKAFKGKGKLMFSKHSSPPHGYDYGMKSGICLHLSSVEISGVEATFEDIGSGAGVQAQGEGKVLYHDGKVTRGTFKDGCLDGLALQYEKQLDKETNLERKEKRLYSLSVFRSGKVGAGRWTLREDGTKLFYPVTAEEGEEPMSLAVIPGKSKNESTQMVLGRIDTEDIMIGARKARLLGLDERSCLKVPRVEAVGDAFDFDLEVRTAVNAVTAKLVRFFEVVSNEKETLFKHFRPNQEPVDAKNARKIMDIKSLAKEDRLNAHHVFNVLTPDGEARALTEGTRMKEGRPVGPHTLKVITDWRRRDVLPIAMEKKKEAEAAKKAKDDKVRKELSDNEDMKKMIDEQKELLQIATEGDNPDKEKDAEESSSSGEAVDSDDLERSRELINSNNATAADMSEAQFEAYMDEFLPYDNLPMRPRPWHGKVVSVHGNFDDAGVLQGAVTLTYGDGSTVEGLAKDGALHGIARHHDPPLRKGRRRRYVRKQVENMVVAVASGMMHSNEARPREVNFVGSYRDGYIDGPGWRFLIGGTFLFGMMKRTTTFTTDNGAFVNQDLLNCYVGQFEDGKMMSGRSARVTGGTADASGVRVPSFSEPAADAVVYRHVEQEKGHLVDPLVPDPTEETWVRVGPSTLGPEAGEGLFAKRDIPENTVVAFYGGLRFSSREWNASRPLDPHYWMKVDGGGGLADAGVMHLPDELGRGTRRYRATLAHKINHSFRDWNCVFHSLDHPRFGLVPAARAVDRVPEGRELLCVYEYEYHEAAPWYQELWRAEIDSDSVYGPMGHRGARKNASEPIAPLTANGTFYNEFHRHATQVLGLEPFT